jgi:hypothetical protein
MTSEDISRPLKWNDLYRVAMLESDRTQWSPLLEEAINAVLDRIEETASQGELELLNNALNGLRSRRKEVSLLMSGRTDSADRTKAA